MSAAPIASPFLVPSPDGRVRNVPDTHHKALQINLDPRRYGTFAEIGAGQEVVRWFFRVGGAAGTIAKSISAYDMKVSDAIYGPCERYVSRARLNAMLDHEHALNLERLKPVRGDNTAFFTFADTVAARNFQGTNECHGWMGVRFQAHPRDEDSSIVIHMRMLDNENALQQEALGILGVNLLYGAFFYHHEPDLLLESLLDNLTINRIEIDMIEFSGIEFRHVDNRLMSLKLVELGLSKAAMFGPNGEVLQPSEKMHRRSILVERGSFRPVCHVNLDMLRCAKEKFLSTSPNHEEPLILTELTMRNLKASGAIDHRDFLARADMLAACGMTVLISDYFEYFRLAAYLRRYTKGTIGLVMGVPSLIELYDEKYYTNLDGGILEASGRLFKSDIKLYVYPLLNQQTGEITTAKTIALPGDLPQLHTFFTGRGLIESLDNYDPACLPIFSRDVLQKIGAGDATWETMVPPAVAEVIKSRSYFGYRPAA
ncbi:MAG: hypothetical protein OHK005_03940 [Candidatus Methylacidiphilales bacterium]